MSPHAAGVWQKKIGGRLHYFGRWGRQVNGELVRLREDGCWQEALEEYRKFCAGGEKWQAPETVTVRDLCNYFRTAKVEARQRGEIGDDSLREFAQICDLLIATFGREKAADNLGPRDFAKLQTQMAKRWGPAKLHKSMTITKMVFGYGYQNNLLQQPAQYGSFKKPSQKEFRKTKSERGKKLLTADHIDDPEAEGQFLFCASPRWLRDMKTLSKAAEMPTPLKERCLQAMRGGQGRAILQALCVRSRAVSYDEIERNT